MTAEKIDPGKLSPKARKLLAQLEATGWQAEVLYDADVGDIVVFQGPAGEVLSYPRASLEDALQTWHQEGRQQPPRSHKKA